jgi:hypothetical protein
MERISDIVKIGVSGHRFLIDTPFLRNSVINIFENIYSIHPHSKFQIISPLALGADQLVAECGLEKPETSLIVLLPLPVDEYTEEFSAGEKEKFLELFSKREKTLQVPFTGKNDDAYLFLGKYLLDLVDYLIVLWNGKPARGSGGTAQIVKLASLKQLPTAWVRVHNAVPGNPISLDKQYLQGSIEYRNWK